MGKRTTTTFLPGEEHRNYKHGLSRHPGCMALKGARDRCDNPKNPRYDRYGARGITVCKEWRDDIVSFWTHMGSTWAPGMTLERIDNDGHYEPGNCKWATPKEQARNRRNNVYIDTPWGSLSLAEAAERAGINYQTFWRRYKIGRTGRALFGV